MACWVFLFRSFVHYRAQILVLQRWKEFFEWMYNHAAQETLKLHHHWSLYQRQSHRIEKRLPKLEGCYESKCCGNRWCDGWYGEGRYVPTIRSQTLWRNQNRPNCNYVSVLSVIDNFSVKGMFVDDFDALRNVFHHISFAHTVKLWFYTEEFAKRCIGTLEPIGFIHTISLIIFNF